MITAIHGVIASSGGNSLGWAQVGNTLTIAGATSATPAALTPTQIALVDDGNAVLTTYDWDGTNWTQTGNSLALTAPSGLLNLSALSSTRVAFIDGNAGTLETYDWDGTIWAQTGNTLLIDGLAVNGGMSALTSTDVVIGANYLVQAELRTYRFDGTDWAQQGSSITLADSAYLTVSNLNSTDVVLATHTGDEFINYRFTGSTTWAEYGTRYSVAGASFPTLGAMTASRIAYFDTTINEIRAYDFDGSTWTHAGNPVATPPTTNRCRIAALDANTAVYANANTITTYQYT